jgi:choline dehydrogenase-like flavoprotein
MLFVRGNAANYDSWAAEGCQGWSYADVLPSFKKVESWEDGENEFRGGAGPIRVRRQTDVTTATLGFMEAFADTAGVKVLDDYNGESQEGIAIVQQSADGGLRYSSSVGYLDDHGMPHLDVVTGVTVARVVVDKGRAVGVEVLVEGGGRQVVRAAREVVLCAGVFGSAQLLQLSGIGPAEHLRSLGIAVIEDLPVGDNLHDHLFVPMCFLMPEARN